MADDKPAENALDAWMAHIDQNQSSKAPRGRQVTDKAAEKRPPAPPARPAK